MNFLKFQLMKSQNVSFMTQFKLMNAKHLPAKESAKYLPASQ